MCKSMNFVFILVIHQKLAALMVQWVATEREKVIMISVLTMMLDNDDERGMMTMTMKEL